MGIKLFIDSEEILKFIVDFSVITPDSIYLKGKVAQGSNQKSYLRKTLTVVQFAVSLLFIIGTIIIGEQIHFILNGGH